MTWLVAVAAFLSLVVLGIWLPLLWIGAGVVLVFMVFYAIGLSRRSGLSKGDPHTEAESE